MIDPLEPRRLFAYDLVITGIDEVITASTQTKFEATIHCANVGADDFGKGPEKCQVVLFISKDSVYGNADDVEVGTPRGPDYLYYNNDEWDIDEDEVFTGAAIPSDLPNGSYFLAASIEVFEGGTEKNVSNNTFITSKPVLSFNRSLVWPSATINGTASDDVILVDGTSPIYVTVNGERRQFPYGALICDAGSGNDKVVLDENLALWARITGSGGNDTIVGGASSDELSGGNGKDKVFGSNGDDYLLGGAGNDYLLGGNQNDTLSGAGGNDRLIDISGRDSLLGGAGNDVVVTRDVAGTATIKRDTISGGEGDDRAQIDDDDIVASIAEILA